MKIFLMKSKSFISLHWQQRKLRNFDASKSP